MKKQDDKQKPTTLSLFDLLYYFPTSEQDLKDSKKIDNNIKLITTQIKKMQKQNLEEVEKVCVSHKKLVLISKMLSVQKVSSTILNMFCHLAISPKLINFLIKLNVPLLIYRLLIKFIERSKDRFDTMSNSSKKQIQECLKFILEYSKNYSKKIPRLYANLIGQLIQKEQKFNDSVSIYPSLLVQISIQILKNNILLAAESELLQILYKKILQGRIQTEKIRIIAQMIVSYCVKEQTRRIIINSIDLGKAFAIFNNVDLRYLKVNQVNSPLTQLKFSILQKNCNIIQIFLTSWPTLVYLMQQKYTLINFLNCLNKKTIKELSIIKQNIFKKIINKTLDYDKERMERSQNFFGYKSNYLNFRSLTLLNFLLWNNVLYDTFETLDKQGDILQNLSQICLQYFPQIFDHARYNKKIVKNIRISKHYQTFICKDVYKKENQNPNQQILINIKSFCEQPLVHYDFSYSQMKDFLLNLKQDKIYSTIPEQIQEQISVLLEQVKRQEQNIEPKSTIKIQGFLASFYKVLTKAFQFIPWEAKYLKIAKFLSAISQFLVNSNSSHIQKMMIEIMKNLFTNPIKDYYRYLIVTVLDDIGKLLAMKQDCQQIIIEYYKNQSYSFRISRILFNIDFQKISDKALKKEQFQLNVLSPKKLLQFFATQGGSTFLILQIIEVIKRNFNQNEQKTQNQVNFLIELICRKIIYHQSQQIVTNCLQYCQEIIGRTNSMQSFVMLIDLKRIAFESLRKRASYLFLRFSQGFKLVTQLYPNFLKEQLQNWFKDGSSPNLMKEYCSFLLKEVKRYNGLNCKDRQASSFLNLGFDRDERKNLVSLPWNVKINDDYYVALAEYKSFKQKIKLRVKMDRKIQQQIVISVVNIGSNKFGKVSQSSSQETTVTIRLQQIAKTYQRNKYKQSKQSQTFAVSKQQVTLFCRIHTEDKKAFYLQKININIYLSKTVYRPLMYPLCFFNLMASTKEGVQFCKKQKVLQKCYQIIQKQEDQQKIKGSLFCLASFLCENWFDVSDKLLLLDNVMKLNSKSTNFQIAQICEWIMNILSKEEDVKKKIKEDKRWKIAQTKYCKSLCFFSHPQNCTKTSSFNRLQYLKDQMPQKLQGQSQAKQFKLLYGFFNNQKKQLELLNLRQVQNLKKNVLNNSKVFQNIMNYIGLLNYGTQKISIMFQMYKDYLGSQKFQKDFPMGFELL